MKKRRFMALLLACCMVCGQTVWAQDAEEGVENIPIVQEEVNETEEKEVVDELKKSEQSEEKEVPEEADETESPEKSNVDSVETEEKNSEVENSTVKKEIYTKDSKAVEQKDLILHEGSNDYVFVFEEGICESKSDNEDVCKTYIKKITTENGEMKQVFVEGIKAGTANVTILCDGEELVSLKVTVKSWGTDEVAFRDENLLSALFAEEVDKNKDGKITTDELKSRKKLSLYYSGITDLTGLEKAENLISVDLNGNDTLDNIDALFSMNQLEYINLSGTAVSKDDRWKLAKISKTAEGNKGFDIPIVANGDIFDDDFKMNIVEGEQIVGLSHYSVSAVNGKEYGTAKIHISYYDYSADVVVTVKGIPADQEVGEKSELSSLTAGQMGILTSNGKLWDIYPEPKSVRTDVKKYVSGWVYSGQDEVVFKYALDSKNVLWSQEQKLAENIKRVTGHYALNDQDVLVDIYNQNSVEIENVDSWYEYSVGTGFDEYGKHEGYETNTYVLKKDGTLWVRLEVGKNAVVNSFKKVVENVKEINDGGYLKENGDFVAYYDGQIKKSGIANLGGWCDYVGLDGNTYLDMDGKDVNIGKVKVVECVYADEAYFCLTEDNRLLKCYSSGNVITVATGVQKLRGMQGAFYMTSDGKWFTLEGKTGTEAAPIVCRSDRSADYENAYTLNDCGNVYDYNVMINDVVVLTHVKDMWSDWYEGKKYFFAVRTDGTLWDVTDIPKLVLDLNTETYVRGDVNEDGIVNIEDLRIVLSGVCGKIQFTERQIKSADVVDDGKVDIQDLRKELRFVCGKIESL